MSRLLEDLETLVSAAFERAGLDRNLGQVAFSKRMDLCQFQCNGAMIAGKKLGKNPRDVAATVVAELQSESCFAKVEVAGPGFINLTLTNSFLTDFVTKMGSDPRLGCPKAREPKRIIIDYGGANIAKPLHVGHLRSGIIGESLKRLGRFVGHDVKGDVHLGDWGLQMGMVIYEIQCRQPELPYFKEDYRGPFSKDSPVAIDDLEEIYPAIASRAKANREVMDACRAVTAELQRGNSGYRALWQHIYNVSIEDLKKGYSRLNIEFDLWLGESDTRDIIPELIADLKASGDAVKSDGALVVEISEPGDDKAMPPLLLTKKDGAVLYGTTDLATIAQRTKDYDPHLLLYVVDRRQHTHFNQVFRAARKTGVASDYLQLEHIGFGTMNGKDGKPFKTRSGGVMKLHDLIKMVTDKASERLREGNSETSTDDTEAAEIAWMVGVATLKYADLNNHPSTDYVFDLDRFSSFDGRTGPYQLYTAVRIKSILAKAKNRNISSSALLPPQDDSERTLLLKLSILPEVIHQAYERRAPNLLCEYCYELGSTFNMFYHDHHIMREPDKGRQGSWLTLAQTTLASLTLILELLGIEVPERM